MQCLLLSAGLGTRLKPLTDTMSKALVPIAGVPLLERQIRHLVRQGVTRFVVNVHYFAQQIKDFLQQHHNFDCDIVISDERQMLLDTGGALQKALPLFDSAQPILIHNVDIIANICLADVYDYHRKNDAMATLVVSERNSSRSFLFNSRQQLCGWRNNKTGEEKQAVATAETLIPLAFAGIHIANPRIGALLSSFPPKFSIVDAYLAVAEHQRVLAYNIGKENVLDVGTIEKYEQAQFIDY
ncbi:mannose-1-phosphate guanylyltransferase [Bacteroidia bacterium]|nr:mannose-1-phosphate guanylyltransferase [Bacteroidia bacterium]GHT81540.1 mannose-1-phosphate guanylyltransferase [Bacteroidia bacterium]